MALLPRRALVWMIALVAAASVGAVPAAAQTWQIDSAHSRAQFTVKHLGIGFIRVYRATLSPLLRGSCRFEPSIDR